MPVCYDREPNMILRTISILIGAALMAAAQHGDSAFPAHKVVGNVYYVGSTALASYLIATPQGHILINSSFEETVPLIRASVEKLGFKFGDIKILLDSHAHSDHVAGNALVKQLTGARVMVMKGDENVVSAETSSTQTDGRLARWTKCCTTARRCRLGAANWWPT